MHRSAKLGLYGLVIAGLVGGTVAWASADKSVTVTVEGQARIVHTMSSTVGAALHDAKISVHPHDALAPSANTPIHDKSRIVLLRGKLLHLDVDGHRKDVWTTAQTVDQALAQLGYGQGALIGVSRSKRLGLSPTELSLITSKRVVVTADGKNRTVQTTAASVGALLASMRITLAPTDTLSMPTGSALVQNAHVVVTRVRYRTETHNVPTPYGTTSTQDPGAYVGTTTVVVVGKAGLTQQVVQYVYVNGRLTGKRLVSSTVVQAPTTQQQKVGTKARPVQTTTTPPGSSGGSGGSGSGGGGGSSGGGGGGDPTPVGDAQAIAKQMVDAHGWGSGEFGCLVNLWNRESGWNTHAANPSGAYGIPQALPGSKMANAGPDWQDNATTQITWGLSYISGVYGTPCNAWAHSNNTGWY